MELDCRLTRSGKRGSSKMTVYMTITFEDGEDIRFHSGDYGKAYYGEPQNWLAGMTRMLENYDHAVITYEHTDRLPRVVRDRELDAEETTMLYALFGQ